MPVYFGLNEAVIWRIVALNLNLEIALNKDESYDEQANKSCINVDKYHCSIYNRWVCFVNNNRLIVNIRFPLIAELRSNVIGAPVEFSVVVSDVIALFISFIDFFAVDEYNREQNDWQSG